MDPFDHSACGHRWPTYVIHVTDTVQIDLLRALRIIWNDVAKGNLRYALAFVEELGSMLTMADLGYHAEIDASVQRSFQTRRDLETLADSQEFDKELRKLLGESE